MLIHKKNLRLNSDNKEFNEKISDMIDKVADAIEDRVVNENDKVNELMFQSFDSDNKTYVEITLINGGNAGKIRLSKEDIDNHIRDDLPTIAYTKNWFKHKSEEIDKWQTIDENTDLTDVRNCILNGLSIAYTFDEREPNIITYDNICKALKDDNVSVKSLINMDKNSDYFIINKNGKELAIMLVDGEISQLKGKDNGKWVEEIPNEFDSIVAKFIFSKIKGNESKEDTLEEIDIYNDNLSAIKDKILLSMGYLNKMMSNIDDIMKDSKIDKKTFLDTVNDGVNDYLKEIKGLNSFLELQKSVDMNIGIEK